MTQRTTNRAPSAIPAPHPPLTLVLAVLLAAGGCDTPAQPGRGPSPIEPPGEASVPAVERERYRIDAARLALRWASRDRSLAELPVEIPDKPRESLYAALLHVHAAADLPARDTVADLHDVHAFPRPVLREMLVSVEADADWIEAWDRGERLTGYAAVDALVERWQLEPVRFYRWSVGRAAVLRSSRPLNVAALGSRFEEIRGVRHADPNHVGGDGHDIEAELAADGWRLDYSVGWGDCPAGCIHRHHWVFRISVEGAVQLLESRGPSPPEATTVRARVPPVPPTWIDR